MARLGQIGTVLGVVASAASIVGFLSVKPLPAIEKFGLDICSNNINTTAFFQKLYDHREQIAFINLEIGADVVLQDVPETQAEDTDAAVISCKKIDTRFVEADQDDWTVQQLERKVFFRLPIVDELFDGSTPQLVSGDGQRYEAIPDLLVPNKGLEFVKVDWCEAHCYNMNGPVLVKSLYESEGYAGIALIPIDVHKNAYLHGRYECRLKVNNSSNPLLGWLSCIF